jgi:type VI secretion system protein ImpA
VAGGPVTSPAQVRSVLEDLIRYYETHEPSSPLPLLLWRVHRLVGADFLTILKELAPDSVDDLRKLGGLKDEDDD